nr:hypothetical protein [Pseudomonas sp. NW5]
MLRQRDNSVALGPVWRQIHAELEVGEPRGKHLYFSDTMLRILRQEAERASGSRDLLADGPRGSRLEAARQGFIDEKVAPQRPDDGFVLVKGQLPTPLPTLSSELSLRVPLASLNLAAIEQVLVIENLDSFDDWQHYAAPVELSGGLVLYRGHSGLARGTRRLLTALPASTLITAFVDYDPAGLAIAAALGARQWLLPELDEPLLAQGSRAHFLRQSRQAAHLDNLDLGGWQPGWDAMKAHQVSIKQQHMLALHSPLRLLTR